MVMPRRLAFAALAAIAATNPAFAGPAFATIFNFTGRNGFQPESSLIMNSAGELFGTASQGGTSPNCNSGFSIACGTVYSLTPPASGKGKWKQTVLHSFGPPRGAKSDGGRPQSELVADASGALYGTTSDGGDYTNLIHCELLGCGTVYKLTPPRPGEKKWQETVLIRFEEGADGGTPIGGLVIDSSGALYGTTSAGGPANPNCPNGCGVIFKLTPPAPGQNQWTETILHSFTYLDGATPYGTLVPDSAGGFYGSTTEGGPVANRSSGLGGVVFHLTPPSQGETKWTETVLQAFSGNATDGAHPGTLYLDANGNLFGAAEAGGLVNFNDCNLAAASTCGLIFELSPPTGGNGSWAETVLHRFTGGADGANPFAPVIETAGGALVGGTSLGGSTANGVLFSLTPPAMGHTGWTETVLHDFTSSTDGNGPVGGVLDVQGSLFATSLGGGNMQDGSAFKLTP